MKNKPWFKRNESQSIGVPIPCQDIASKRSSAGKEKVTKKKALIKEKSFKENRRKELE
jgi:hypothetical protein